jgi:hypothetical protein
MLPPIPTFKDDVPPSPALTCALAGALACDSTLPLDEDTGTEVVSQPLYPKRSALWSNWSIPVCWENANDALTERGWVRSAVENSWHAHSAVRSTASGIRRGLDRDSHSVADEGPPALGLGTDLASVVWGMVLNFPFDDCRPAPPTVSTASRRSLCTSSVMRWASPMSRIDRIRSTGIPEEPGVGRHVHGWCLRSGLGDELLQPELVGGQPAQRYRSGEPRPPLRGLPLAEPRRGAPRRAPGARLSQPRRECERRWTAGRHLRGAGVEWYWTEHPLTRDVVLKPNAQSMTE